MILGEVFKLTHGIMMATLHHAFVVMTKTKFYNVIQTLLKIIFVKVFIKIIFLLTSCLRGSG